MKFYDIAKILVKSGSGGNGIVSGRREKYLAFGGPAGGDGGRGGSVILRSTNDENTLSKYRYKKEYKALKGGDGKTFDKNGKDSENLFLNVPVGTVVKDVLTGNILYQFLNPSEEFVVAKGGTGGRGNRHFTSPSKQFPGFALLGEPGESREIVLELQLLGDIALIGAPSVGKSTIINCLSNAKAKVAQYHFTTIIPNLGIVKYGDITFTLVDIPGLIQGASDGRGLGNKFLRHILKANIFAFVLDLGRYEQGMDEFIQLWYEIFYYIEDRFVNSNDFGDTINQVEFEISNDGNNIVLNVFGWINDKRVLILKKLVFIILNKYDLLNDLEILNEYINNLSKLIKSSFGKINKITQKNIKANILTISAVLNYDLSKLKDFMGEKITTFKGVGIESIDKIVVNNFSQDYITDVTDVDMDYLLDNQYLDFTQAKFCKIWEYNNKEFAYWVYILPWGNDEAEMRFWEKMGKEGFLNILQKHGVVKGDIIKVKSPYIGTADRYIMRD